MSPKISTIVDILDWRSGRYVLAFLVLMGGTAAAGDAPRFLDKQWSAKERSLLGLKPRLLPPNWRHGISMSAPPGVDASRRELSLLADLATQRQARSEAIKRQAPDADTDFESALGIKFAEHPALRNFVHAIARDTAIVVMHLKNDFKRARPWQIDRTLTSSIERPQHPSYPSGHATQAHTIASALTDLFPDCRDRLNALAVEIGLNREVAGVHFPSDTMAGQKLAEQLLKQLRKSAQFQDLLSVTEKVTRNVSVCGRAQ